ncbi:MAG: glycosyltransferase [Candidatus Eisenbacteria bacterium]|nr:glycosyltransferase [Candidatus Eisenbacteria bacterium]
MESLHKPRVLLLIHSLVFAGAERVVVDMAKELDVAGYKVAICVFAEVEGLAAELDHSRISLYVVQKKRRFDFVLLFRLISLLRRFKPHVLSMHCRDALHFGAPAALIAGVPIRIATEHSVGPGTNQFLNRLAFGLSSPTLSATVAVSEFLKRFMVQKWGFRPERIKVIHNGVDFARLGSGHNPGGLRRELGLSPGTRIVGNAGRLGKEKGHDQFLEIASKVACQDSLVHFVLIGNGPALDRLKALAAELGLADRVHFMAARLDAPSVVTEFDVFLCTSQIETFGLAVVEAMYLGVPVVAFDVGSLNEIITDGVNGFLVSHGDIEAASGRVLSLLGDPVLRGVITKSALETVEGRFSVQKMTRAYEELFGVKGRELESTNVQRLPL